MIHRALLIAFGAFAFAGFAQTLPKPDIVVAADGSADFKTVQAAVASIPEANRERIVVFIKDGVHRAFVTLRGESLARHHLDAQLYFLDCTFARTMADRPIKRVIYPTSGATPSEAHIQKNPENDLRNLWGGRNYFWNCRREGGDFAWHSNNLATAEGAPTAEQITAAWTFANTGNPERNDRPVIK